MEAFEDLKSKWKNQEELLAPKDGVKQVLEIISDIRKKQGITNTILSITVLVLIAFFFYISAYKLQATMIGLLLMIGVLIARIAIEFYSIRKLRSMNPIASASLYKQQLLKYHDNRRKVHFVITPMIVIAYCIGFYMLLPDFKANLSSGLYNYIIISGILLLFVLGLFIAKQIIQELRVLRNLNS